MNKKFAGMLLGASIFAASGMAFAQFGGLPKVGGGAAAGGGVSAEQIVKKYVGGTQSVMNANANMLAAIGKKEESERAALQAKNLTEAATKDQIEEAAKVQTEGSKAIEAELSAKNVTLDAAGKKKFGEGVGDLAKGIIQYVGMGSEVKGFKPSPTSLGGAANSALFIVKNLPDSIKNLASTLNKAIEFSKANNIALPKEANDATALLK